MLNETNIIYADFLPEPEKFVRGTIIPGFAIVHSKTFEFGVSASISVTRYMNDADPFGLDRDNTRIQPFLFATYKDDTLDVSASVSRFDGWWDDAEIGNVQQTLYDVSLARTFGDFKLDLAARRTAEDTTFPFVPVTLVTSAGVGLSYKFTPQLTLHTSAKSSRTEYPGVDLASKTTAFGGGASYDFGKDWTLGLDAAYQRGTLIDGEPMTGAMVSFSLARKFNLAQN
jgi:predicted porin